LHNDFYVKLSIKVIIIPAEILNQAGKMRNLQQKLKKPEVSGHTGIRPHNCFHWRLFFLCRWWASLKAPFYSPTYWPANMQIREPFWIWLNIYPMNHFAYPMRNATT